MITKYAVYLPSTGLVLFAAETSSPIEDVTPMFGGQIFPLPGDADINDAGRDKAVVDGQLVSIPPRPSHTHEWDGERWVDQSPLAERIDRKSSQIDAERERRNQLPIEYQGTLFDADAKAQRNVSAWMTNLAVGVALPPGFVWRDYVNVDHPADAAFVTGLGAAITMRGTALYQTAWSKKAELQALTNTADVDSFDPLSGW
jgi:hypothetical protein